jgi:hypothetical protein
LRCPFLALLAVNCVILAATVTILTVAEQALIAHFQILAAANLKLHSPMMIDVSASGTHLTIASCDLEGVGSVDIVWVDTDSRITSIHGTLQRSIHTAMLDAFLVV